MSARPVESDRNCIAARRAAAPASALARVAAGLSSFAVGAGITLVGVLLHMTPAPALAEPVSAEPADAASGPAPAALAAFSAPGIDILPEVSAPARRAPVEAPRDVRTIEGQLAPGSTVYGSLVGQGVPPRIADRVGKALRPVFDLRRARPGHRYRLLLAGDESAGESELVAFEYRTSSLDRYRVVPGDDGWQAERVEVPLVRRRARLAGMVTTSLYDSIVQLGEQPQLARDLADIFAWDVDFTHSAQPGDEFRVLYERVYGFDDLTGEEVYVGPGRILAARYTGVLGEHTAIYFEPEDGRGGYYRPDGSSVERQFLAAPLSYTRISSSYSQARLHPILKIRRPHHGIDYAAPYGSPVWSVADGKVIYKGWAGGFGRLVKVRHTNGYISYYAHLSRFAKGLAVGQVVQQKQVVGYVGKSGLATGPHVCFRIARDGHYVNPATLRTPAGRPIPTDARAEFARIRDELLRTIGPPRFVGTDEAL